MTRRALVLGSQIEGLKGVDNDTRRMAAWLAEHDFAVDLRVGADATRAGMLAGYDRLIASSNPGDAAVVYYCGHGFYESVPHEGRSWQCIVPTDLRQSTVDDWRGITAWELSIKQTELTNRTPNVTVILDCCHSAQLSRNESVVGAIPRALPHPVTTGFDHHLQALREAHKEKFDAVDPIGNQHAVRLVACGQSETAFECPDGDGEYHGAFTEALIAVLNQAGDAPASWASLIGAVRARVLRQFRRQRPDVEGPSRRRPFTLAEHDDIHAVAVRAIDGRFRLSTGRLTGAAVGDVYGILPDDAATQDYDTDALAQVEITEVHATISHARQTTASADIPSDAVAVPIRRRVTRWPVATEGPATPRAMIDAALEASPTLRPARPGEHAIASVRIERDAVTLEDATGPLGPPLPLEGGLSSVLAQLANLGVAQGLRELEGEHGVFASELSIELGVVHDGQPRRLPHHGGQLQLRDRYYLNVERRGPRTLFAHVLAINARGKITLLTQFSRGGVVLDRDKPSLNLGLRQDGTLGGVGMRWPDGLPVSSGPRLTELVVLATPMTSDLSGLETRDVIVGRNSGTRLQRALAELCDGTRRDACIAPHGPDGFFVKRLSVSLDPGDGAERT